MTDKQKSRRTYNCSFCGKDQDHVQRLIAGPHYVFICDECIDVFSKGEAEQRKEESHPVYVQEAGVAYRCSFCAKKQSQVQHLNFGPGGVNICSECIDLCNEILDKEQQK